MADQINDWAGLNLSGKGSSAMANSLAAAAAAVAAEAQDDAPLNLSMKSSKSDSRASPAPSPAGSGSTPSANSLQSLSTITAALGGSGGNDTPRCKLKIFDELLRRFVVSPSFVMLHVSSHPHSRSC